jgi:hypothetical protein
MQIEVIYCPVCRNKLRIPEDLLGTEVQCPECKTQFLAPPPPPGRASGEATEPQRTLERYGARTEIDESGAQQNGNVAGARNLNVWVTVAGLLQVGASGLGLLAAAFRFVLAYSPEMQRAMMQNNPFAAMAGKDDLKPTLLLFGVVFGLVSLIGVGGGLAMAARRGYILALIGSFAAVVNLGDCCCLLTAPVGALSLYFLFQPDVRASFR